jgi:hypothetical protein
MQMYYRTKIIFREIKIIFHPLGSLVGFPARVIVLWQKNVGGTRNASLASDRYNVVVDVVFKDNMEYTEDAIDNMILEFSRD